MKTVGLYYKWNKFLDEINIENKDIYFKEEYVKLYETDKKRAVAFVYEEDENVLVFPFLINQVPGTNYYDFETAYGYGGVVANTENKQFLEKVWSAFSKISLRENIVAGFIRLHPLLNNYRLLNSTFSVYDDRNTVAIDLTISEDDIWNKEIHSKHRNVIRKAKSQGLHFEIDENLDRMDEFYDLYNSTMSRINADSFYYFKKNYYDQLRENLYDNSFLSIVSKDSKVFSMAIIIYSAPYGHYHLSGSEADSLKYYPNNYLLYMSALELKKRKCSFFHLGGGTTDSQDDSLFKFKKRFSKSVRSFKIAKTILNPQAYEEICNQWAKKNPEKVKKYDYYTLKYRL